MPLTERLIETANGKIFGKETELCVQQHTDLLNTQSYGYLDTHFKDVQKDDSARWFNRIQLQNCLPVIFKLILKIIWQSAFMQ